MNEHYLGSTKKHLISNHDKSVWYYFDGDHVPRAGERILLDPPRPGSEEGPTWVDVRDVAWTDIDGIMYARVLVIKSVEPILSSR